MENESEHWSFGFWKKAAIVLVALFVADAVWVLHPQIRYGDVLFFEGLIVLGVGAFAASGVANLRRETAATTAQVLAGKDPEGQRELLKEERRKEMSSGISLMIAGAIIIILSIISTSV